MSNLSSKAIWILFSDGGAKLFGFLTTIYLARTLGAEQYGLITLAITVLGITMWFSDLGLNTLATRSMAASTPGERNPARFFWLKIFLSLLVMVISGVVIWFVMSGNPTLRALILLFLLSLLPQALQIEWYFKGVQKFEWVTLANWIQGGLYLGSLFVFVSTEDLFFVPLLYSASILAGSLSMILSYRGKVPLNQKPDISKWVSDVRKSFFLGAGHFLSQSIILLPPLMIGFFFGELQVGYYGVAFKLILVIMLADHVFGTLLLPNLTKLWVENKSNVKPQLQTVARWMFFFGCIGAIVLYYSAETVIVLLFGTEYLAAAEMLKVLCFLLPVTFLNTVYSFGLISFGKDREFMMSTLFGGAGAFLFMTAGGLTGIVYWLVAAVVLSEIWITICMYVPFRRYTELPLTSYIVVLIFFLVILLAAGAFIPWHNLVIMAIVIPLFSFLVFITGYIKRYDVEWLKRKITQ